MAIAMVIQFSGVNAADYEAVNKELGIGPDGGWPKGLISHVAGATADGGWCVVDVWDSQADWDAFAGASLMPALAKVGTVSQPNVTQFQVHNRHQRA